MPTLITAPSDYVVSPVPSRPRVLVTGAAGAIGQILGRRLKNGFELVGIDPAPFHSDDYSKVIAARIEDVKSISEAVDGCHYVIHGATGAAGGWAQLQQVDILGTSRLLQAAVDAGVTRVVFLSTNHVNGLTELEALHNPGKQVPYTDEELRPDGYYGIAKATAELLLRSFTEFYGLKASIIRIGTVRENDSPDAASSEPGLAYIGDNNQVLKRLGYSWLTHDDLVRMIHEEISAPEDFRRRYGTSSNKYWHHSIYKWSRS